MNKWKFFGFGVFIGLVIGVGVPFGYVAIEYGRHLRNQGTWH